MNVLDSTHILSLLLDAIPVAALLLLAIDFLRTRHRMKTEERRLRKALEELRGENGKSE